MFFTNLHADCVRNTKHLSEESHHKILNATIMVQFLLLINVNSNACPGVSYSRTGQPSIIVSYITESTTSIFTVEITDSSKSRRVTKQVTLKTLGMNSPQVNIMGINELLKFDIAESVSFKSEFIKASAA